MDRKRRDAVGALSALAASSAIALAIISDGILVSKPEPYAPNIPQQTVSSDIAAPGGDASAQVADDGGQVSQATPDEADEEPPVPSRSYDYPPSLPKGLRADYDRTCDALLSGKTQVVMAAHTKEDIDRVLWSVCVNQPECFFFSGEWQGSLYDDRAVVRLGAKYPDAANRRKAVDDATRRVLAKMPKGMSQYDTSLWIYDYLAINDRYEYVKDGSDQDVWGALVGGKCVCGGYARAYAYLMRKCGIECDVIVGRTDESHAWCRSVIDGKTYYTDPTWGDRDATDGTPQVNHSWLNVTSAQIGATHTPQYPEDQPDAEYTDGTWFAHGGSVLMEATPEELTRAISKQPGNVIEVGCATPEVYAWLKGYLQEQSAFDAIHASGHDCSRIQTLSSESGCDWSLMLLLS